MGKEQNGSIMAGQNGRGMVGRKEWSARWLAKMVNNNGRQSCLAKLADKTVGKPIGKPIGKTIGKPIGKTIGKPIGKKFGQKK